MSTPTPPPPPPCPCGGTGGTTHTSTEGGVLRQWWTRCGTCR